MIIGGKGGATTNKNGLAFERRVDLKKIFKKLKGYSVRNNELYFDNKLVAKFYSKHALYILLNERNIEWTKRISKKLLPDEAMYVSGTKTLHIIEMKFQRVSGSVDEKLQTCDFKLKQYKKLFAGTDVVVKYHYILNDWFKQNQYKDTLDYVGSVGCEYYFKTIPWKTLGIPKP